MKRLAATLLFFSSLAPTYGQSQAITVTRKGSEPSTQGPAENFTGLVRVEPLFPATEPSRVSGALVTFEPGARAAWHTHPLGQFLIVTSGTGLVQQWGGAAQEIREGDVVRIPPGQKHWHGATATTRMAHIALQEQQNGKNVHWMEKVTEEQYSMAQTTTSKQSAGGARAKTTDDLKNV